MDIGTIQILGIVSAVGGMIFKREVLNLLLDYIVFKRRAFNDGDELEILNEATGKWHHVKIEDYSFGFSAADRTVGVIYPENGKRTRIPFQKWAALSKRT